VAYKFGKDAPVYALEGSVAVAGAAIEWLKNNLQIIKEPSEVSVYASQVTDNAGVYFVPAFSGLFAPYWKEARGCIVGLTQYSTKQHICLSALEAICFQSKEIIDAMNLDFKSDIKSLNVDGGLTKSSLLLQIQADILGVPVHCPNMNEITALGAALAGALGAGVFKSLSEFKQSFGNVTYHPKTAKEDRAESLKKWKQAIEKAMIN
jgi:glycerol kinase